jgi:hypothetical protein
MQYFVKLLKYLDNAKRSYSSSTRICYFRLYKVVHWRETLEYSSSAVVAKGVLGFALSFVYRFLFQLHSCKS